MANKYCNLVGTNKIKDEYAKINTGFDRVETDIDALNDLVDTLENSGIDVEAREDIAEINELLGDDELETEAQTITGAINELKNSETDSVTVNDTLTSTSATEALSAKQGKILKDALDAHKADNVNSKTVHGLRIEAGTWTPTIAGYVVAGSNTYANQTGIYYKIGRLVYCHGRIALSTKDNSMDGGVRIGGLPFAASAGYHSVSFGWVSYFNYSDDSKDLVGYAVDNTIPLYESVDNGNRIIVLPSQINDNTEFRFSLIYTTA